MPPNPLSSARPTGPGLPGRATEAGLAAKGGRS